MSDPSRGGSAVSAIMGCRATGRLTGTIAPSVEGMSRLGRGQGAQAFGSLGRLAVRVRVAGVPSARSRRIVRVVTIPKNHLMLIAGLVWCAAGAMVCMVGLPLEFGLAPAHLVLLPLAGAIFLAFYFLVFSRLVRKHTGRIRARTEERLPVWNFFNASSWAVMAVMMCGGMALRFSHVMPDWMIAFFYSGLGLALFLCGVRFLGVFARKDVLALAPDRFRADA